MYLIAFIQFYVRSLESYCIPVVLAIIVTIFLVVCKYKHTLKYIPIKSQDQQGVQPLTTVHARNY